MTNTTVDRPDTHQMVVGHRAFRREFRLLPGLIEAVPVGDTRRARVLAEHAGDVTTALHAHHSSEDDVLWPRLLDRAGLHAELVHRMEHQHEQVGHHLERIESLLDAWAGTAGGRDRSALAATFAAACVVLEEHLDRKSTRSCLWSPGTSPGGNGVSWASACTPPCPATPC